MSTTLDQVRNQPRHARPSDWRARVLTPAYACPFPPRAPAQPAQDSAKSSLRRAGSFSRQKKTRADGKSDQDYSEDSLTNPRTLAEIVNPQDELNDVVAKEAVDLFDKGQYDEAGEKWWALAEHARATGNKSQECTALHNVGTALVMMHELTEAVTCYNKALQVALDSEDRDAQVELYECLAWVYRELGHAPHAIECLNALMMLHEDAGNSAGQVLAMCGLGSIHDATGSYAEAAGYYDHALSLARDSADEKAVARVLGDLGTSYVQMGDFDKGVECYTEALEMAVAEGDRDREMRTYGNLAIAANLRERDEEAVAFFQKAIEIAHELGEKATETRARADLALVLRALGRIEPAIESLGLAVELARAQSDLVAVGEHLTQLGATKLKYQSDALGAEPHLAQAVDAWREYAALLRAQLCESRVSAQQRNSDNLETAEFFDARIDGFVLLQLALVQLGRTDEALAIAEESHALATRELLALGGKDHRAVGELLGAGREFQTALDARADAAGIHAIAQEAGCPLLMLTISGENEVLAWVVPSDKAAAIAFFKLDLAPALAAAGCTSVVHAVSRLHEAVNLSALALDCRGSPRGAEGAAVPSADDLAEAATTAQTVLTALHAALLAPLLPALGAAKELCVLPSGVLALVPFCALAPAADPTSPLIKSMAVCSAPNAAAFACMRRRERARIAEGGLPKALVVANAATLGSLKLAPIPHADEEAHAIADLLRSVRRGRRARRGGGRADAPPLTSPRPHSPSVPNPCPPPPLRAAAAPARARAGRRRARRRDGAAHGRRRARAHRARGGGGAATGPSSLCVPRAAKVPRARAVVGRRRRRGRGGRRAAAQRPAPHDLARLAPDRLARRQPFWRCARAPHASARRSRCVRARGSHAALWPTLRARPRWRAQVATCARTACSASRARSSARARASCSRRCGPCRTSLPSES